MTPSQQALFDYLLKSKRDQLLYDPDILYDWLYTLGSATQVLFSAALFMPELEELEGSVLLSHSIAYEQQRLRFLECIKANAKAVKEIESSFNWVEVGYLFDAPGRDTTDEEDELLAHLIRDAWDAWLSKCYPGRTFKVEVLSPEQTGSTVGVQFYEVR